jgi:hypothetical protein
MNNFNTTLSNGKMVQIRLVCLNELNKCHVDDFCS